MNKDRIMNEIKAAIGNDVEVSFVEVPKNNVIRKGISIRKGDSNIAATFYYKEDATDAEIITRTIETYNASGTPDFNVDDITENFTNWDWVASKVVPVLFNKTKSVYSDDVITKDFVNDIGILYKIVVSTNSLGRATVKATKPMLDKWNVTEDELFAKAKENLDKDVIIKDMKEMMFEIMCGRESNDLVREIQPGLMNVMTNTTKVDGAAVMLCLPDFVKNGELEDKDYYIIPSSIHECILVGTDIIEPADLNLMIKDVNANEVALEDFLSDYGLKYDAKLGKIVVA